MTKLIRSKIGLSILISSTLLLTGCNEDVSEAKAIEKKAEVVKPAVVEKKETVVTYNRYDSVEEETFRDLAKIGPENKEMIIIFGTNTDPYSDRLKGDIKKSKELTNRLKNDFSSYYLKAHKNLRHKLFHEDEYMDVDTKTMISIYGIEVTPTIIFTDLAGKAIIVVPGYMPTEQFLVTMKFIKDGAWKGKDRKNGEVYETLRTFYTKNGIEVKKIKAN